MVDISKWKEVIKCGSWCGLCYCAKYARTLGTINFGVKGLSLTHTLSGRYVLLPGAGLHFKRSSWCVHVVAIFNIMSYVAQPFAEG